MIIAFLKYHEFFKIALPRPIQQRNNTVQDRLYKINFKKFYNDLIEHDIEKKEIKILMEKLNNVIFKNDLKS